MKTNLKYQNGRIPADNKKDRRDSLGIEALAVCLINLLCTAALTPLYQWFGSVARSLSVDVEMDGSFAHILCELGANVFFYITSFLGTAAFFIGASYVARAALSHRYGRCAAASAVLYAGMSVPTLLTLISYLIVKLADPGSITLSNPMALLHDALFLLFRVAVIASAACLLSRKNKKPRVCAALSAVFMFLCAAGLELVENISFFMKGNILTVDIVNMTVSMLLYAIHALLGYIIMLRFLSAGAERKS